MGMFAAQNIAGVRLMRPRLQAKEQKSALYVWLRAQRESLCASANKRIRHRTVVQILKTPAPRYLRDVRRRG